MPKLRIIYECDEEIEKIIRNVDKYVDLKHNTDEIKKDLQNAIQTAFDEGRKLQKQIGSTLSRDSLLSKCDP